ncbi:hypothetical protein GCM10011492_32750 [Flexivirga endophytica]|uniref:Lipoprotein n=2 Tax=Flexivirga endophytica TaxID=1849103 RepID=A0A916TD14_9MICO|nr:hypothetical protein [Flexivirga endophytica]GGB39426.1 hypothetical protein GCM10011492_32750 [Flexivirga endophytica]GHB47333.1 hypothetical protein GCM10008112_15140 [Flexivirga endophytica]
MKRLALMTTSVIAVTVLAGCGSSGGGSSAPTSTTDGPRAHEPYKKGKPGQWDSPGVVVANSAGRKVVLDKKLPVFDPPITDGGVAQSDWPAAGRLLSIKELIGVFPDATKIGFTPQGPTKLVITPSLKGDSNSKNVDPNKISLTVDSVGTEDSILATYDGKRASDRTVYTGAGGQPNSGHVYYKDGSFNTHRLSIEPDDGDKYLVVIGNGRTAMQLSIKCDGFYSLDGDGFDSDKVLQQQVMPLIFQLLAARM